MNDYLCEQPSSYCMRTTVFVLYYHSRFDYNCRAPGGPRTLRPKAKTTAPPSACFSARHRLRPAKRQVSPSARCSGPAASPASRTFGLRHTFGPREGPWRGCLRPTRRPASSAFGGPRRDLLFGPKDNRYAPLLAKKQAREARSQGSNPGHTQVT
ncbi:hypothetical protein PVAP13_3NG311860 [Panicum virgatum]|uniref:Uncharacterized protein n=1 Tax=Panicum virgatum TaxID=38727 RepID=A0A8T0UI43_PANVG|nr:hypothetical protein PVAP13_3NG311860 [Panicum virgatum]